MKMVRISREMTPYTPLGKLISLVCSQRPEAHHTARGFFREWIRVLSQDFSTEEIGPGDELDVGWCDGELCVSLTSLIAYLKRKLKSCNKLTALECYTDLLV